MTAAAVLRDSGSSVPMRGFGWRAALSLVVLLMAQVGLYVWMAPRGLVILNW